MDSTEIVEGSILIADFLGWEHYGDGRTYKFPNLYPLYNIDDDENSGWISEQIANAKFHSDWSWLMPVLEKICRMKIGDGLKTIEYPHPRTFGMLSTGGQMMVRLNGFQCQYCDTLIEATWLAVVEFIKWFNTQKK